MPFVRPRPNRLPSAVRRWVRAFAAAVGILAALLGFVVWEVIAGERECPLGLEFEQARSEVISWRGIPPKSVCRFHYVEGADGQPIYPPTIETHDSAPALAVLTFVGVGSLATELLLRPRPQRPVEVSARSSGYA